MGNMYVCTYELTIYNNNNNIIYYQNNYVTVMQLASYMDIYTL